MTETRPSLTTLAPRRIGGIAALALALASAAGAAGAEGWGASECGCLAHRIERAERGVWRYAPGGGKGGAGKPGPGKGAGAAAPGPADAPPPGSGR